MKHHLNLSMQDQVRTFDIQSYPTSPWRRTEAWMDLLNGKSASLDLEEALIALSVSAPVNPAAQLAMEKLPELRACPVRMS